MNHFQAWMAEVIVKVLLDDYNNAAQVGKLSRGLNTASTITR